MTQRNFLKVISLGRQEFRTCLEQWLRRVCASRGVRGVGEALDAVTWELVQLS